MATAPRILVAGSANMDFVIKTPRVPNSGETIISSERYRFVPGGKGANSAVAAARLGADVVFCARLGGDSYGMTLRQAYINENIDTRHVKLDKATQTGLAAVMVENDGSNRIIVFPGANDLLSINDIEEAFTTYPDAFLTQLEINHSVIISAVRQAQERKIPVFLDAGPADKSFPLSSLGRLEVFSPNESEAYTYTGIRPTNTDSYLKIAISLHNILDVKYIVLKLGERGSYIYDGKYCEIVPPFEVEAVDSTAAGDAFTAALTFEYLRSGNITRACKYANAVGALTVTKPGALSSLPTEARVIEFLNTYAEENGSS